MSIIRASILTCILALPMALPTEAFAKPNNGAFKRSNEGMKKARECASIKETLDIYEANADEKGGTPAAKQDAQMADYQWAKGVQAGCWSN